MRRTVHGVQPTPTPMRYTDLLAAARTRARELMPWDLQRQLDGPFSAQLDARSLHLSRCAELRSHFCRAGTTHTTRRPRAAAAARTR